MIRYAGIRGVGLAGSDEELLSLIDNPFTADERREIWERSRRAAYLVETRAAQILAPGGMKLSASGRLAMARVLAEAARLRRAVDSSERRERAAEDRLEACPWPVSAP